MGRIIHSTFLESRLEQTKSFVSVQKEHKMTEECFDPHYQSFTLQKFNCTSHIYVQIILNFEYITNLSDRVYSLNKKE